MNISLYRTSSDKRTLNKALSLKATKSAVLKDNNSVTHPYLVVETFEGWEDCNYLYIDDFERYYFIDDKKPMIGNKIALTCSVDVLMSFRTQLLSLSCIIDKQQNLSQANKYRDDGSYVLLNTVNDTIINFSNGFNENGTYVLICAGGQGGLV